MPRRDIEPNAGDASLRSPSSRGGRRTTSTAVVVAQWRRDRQGRRDGFSAASTPSWQPPTTLPRGSFTNSQRRRGMIPYPSIWGKLSPTSTHYHTKELREMCDEVGDNLSPSLWRRGEATNEPFPRRTYLVQLLTCHCSIRKRDSDKAHPLEGKPGRSRTAFSPTSWLPPKTRR